MKRVAIVTSHFPPSNLAAVHRSRLWAMHLPEFGWKPVIVTCHHWYYEERRDNSLLELLPKWLKVVRVRAFKTKPLRLVGDTGVRSFYWIYKALCELVESSKIDFLLITIPSNFLAPVGMLIKAKYGIRYGIDYIDPWVHDWPGSEKFATKHWFSRRLSEVLEPVSVESADLITGINHHYYSAMLDRNPAVKSSAKTSSMPYGISRSDFTLALKRRDSNIVSEYRRRVGYPNIKIWVYAGAFLPKSADVYSVIFEAMALLKSQNRLPREGLKLFFIGTGRSPNDPNSHQVLPLAKAFEIQDLVLEHPHRMDYADVLSCLIEADGIMIIGSYEKHYSPSKTHQALISGRPVWAALHQDSTAWSLLKSGWGCEGVKLNSEIRLQIDHFAESLEKAFKMKKDFSAERTDLDNTEILARNNAKTLAGALDSALV